MPRSTRYPQQRSSDNIFNLNHSLDSKKDFYRTSYFDDYHTRQGKQASWSAGSSNYRVIPPIEGDKAKKGKVGIIGSKWASKSTSSLSDSSLNRSYGSVPESCKWPETGINCMQRAFMV